MVCVISGLGPPTSTHSHVELDPSCVGCVMHRVCAWCGAERVDTYLANPYETWLIQPK